MEINRNSNNLRDGDEFEYKVENLKFVGKRTNLPKDIKYCVNVFEDDEKVGYFSFFVLPKTDTLRIAGLFIEPKFRGKNISRIYIREMEKLAELNGLINVDTTEQRKPLTCRILTQSGYSPVKKLTDSNRAYVGSVISGSNSRIGVYFQDSYRGADYNNSRLFDSQGCILVSTRDLLVDAIEVSIGNRYVKVKSSD
jgi:GNAT superfamily N-acetyltransferase